MHAFCERHDFFFSHFTNSRIPIIRGSSGGPETIFSCTIDVPWRLGLAWLCRSVLRRNRSSARGRFSNLIALERPGIVLSLMDNNCLVKWHHDIYFRCRTYPTSWHVLLHEKLFFEHAYQQSHNKKQIHISWVIFWSATIKSYSDVKRYLSW